jgi:hypothetical protein
LAGCVVALIVFLETTSALSNAAKAAEILHRAALRDDGGKMAKTQRVRVRFRGEAFVRKVGDIAPLPNDATEPLFRSTGLDWRYPLSARAFAAWHDGLHAKMDRVSYAGDRIAVATDSGEGALRHASFTVQAADFRPIEESLDFGPAGRVDVSAVPDEAETSAVGASAVRNSKTAPPAPIRGTTASSSDDTEASVRFLLHSLGADVQEVLSIRRSGNEIEVTGVVGDADRKQEILNHLDGVGKVAVEIQTAQEFSAQSISHTSALLGSDGSRDHDAPAKPWLEHQFPNVVDREEFVHRALQLTHSISTRAYALSQLAARYPVPAFDSLSPAAGRQITQIVTDLADGINRDQDALRAHFRLLATGDTEEPFSGTWQSAVAHCLTLVRGLNFTVTSLFAAGPQQPREFNVLVEQLGDQLAGRCQIRMQ